MQLIKVQNLNLVEIVHKPNSLLFEPTLLTNIKQNMLVFKRENFGPVVPILIFDKDKRLLKWPIIQNTD